MNLEDVLKHELMTVPLSLAKTNGNLHSTNKSLLSAVLTQDVHCQTSIELDNPGCIIIDGQALVMALGKPSDVKTFGEYANMFVETVLKMGAQYQRIDVAFDRYQSNSIKRGTRAKQKERHRPVHRKIENDMVPIPSDWAGFISLEDNKTDLSLLLSNHLIDLCPTNKLIVVSGGYTESTMVKSSDPSLSVNCLMEDTRLVLHSIHAHFEIVVVAANDTDVLLLLLAHFDRMNCTHLYMKSGTSKAPRYIPIHEISRMLPDEKKHASWLPCNNWL